MLLAGNLLLGLDLPDDVRLWTTIVCRVADHITCLGLHRATLSGLICLLMLNFFKEAQNIYGELKLGPVEFDVLVLSVRLHFVLHPWLDPVPVASVLVCWCVHILEVSQHSLVLVVKNCFEDGLQARQDSLTLASSIGEQRLQRALFPAIGRGGAFENRREVPAHLTAYRISKSYSCLWKLVVHLVAIAFDDLVRYPEYPFHPLFSELIINSKELLHQLQEGSNLFRRAFVRSLQYMFRHLPGKLSILVADMCNKLGEFFAFITMLGGIQVEELELFQVNEERLCAVFRKKELCLLGCEL